MADRMKCNIIAVSYTHLTEEAYYLANSHYYNPNWGYQNGEKRNARIVRQFEPSAILFMVENIQDFQ